MITTEIRPRGCGHRDDGHEEEILQADSDSKKKVTSKHHQREQVSDFFSFVALVDRVRRSRCCIFFLIKGVTGELSGRERFDCVDTPLGVADRTLT